ncbi:MAG: hypothetical protein ACLP01_11405 [Solirubrobacteraceae bacterium]
MSITLQEHALGVTWSETTGMRRAAHALSSDRGVWLIDPFEDAAALSSVQSLGQPAGVLQLLDRHNRDCRELATRLEVPLLALPARAPDSPFEVVPVLSRRRWREVALWWPAPRALIVAEAVGTAPVFALGRQAGAHPLLRVCPPPAALTHLSPEALLTGHGEAIPTDAGGAFQEALDRWRSDLPRLVIQLPSLLRSAR